MKGKLYYLYCALLSSFIFCAWVCLEASPVTAAGSLSVSDMAGIWDDPTDTRILSFEQMREIKAGWLSDKVCDTETEHPCPDSYCRCLEGGDLPARVIWILNKLGLPLRACYVIMNYMGVYECVDQEGQTCNPNAYSRTCGSYFIWAWGGGSNPPTCWEGDPISEYEVFCSGASCAE